MVGTVWFASLPKEPRPASPLHLLWRREETGTRWAGFIGDGGVVLNDGRRLLFLDQLGQRIREIIGAPNLLAVTATGLVSASFDQNLVSYFSPQGLLLWQWSSGEPVEAVAAGRNLILVNTRYEAPAAQNEKTATEKPPPGKTPVPPRRGNRLHLLDDRGRRVGTIDLPEGLVTALAIDPSGDYLGAAILSAQDYQTTSIKVFDRRGRPAWEVPLGGGLVTEFGLFARAKSLWAKVEHARQPALARQDLALTGGRGGSAAEASLIWSGPDGSVREIPLAGGTSVTASPEGWLAVINSRLPIPWRLWAPARVTLYDAQGNRQWEKNVPKPLAGGWLGSQLLLLTDKGLLSFAAGDGASWRVSVPEPSAHLLFNPDGSSLLMFSPNGSTSLYLWDRQSPRNLR